MCLYIDDILLLLHTSTTSRERLFMKYKFEIKNMSETNVSLRVRKENNILLYENNILINFKENLLHLTKPFR